MKQLKQTLKLRYEPEVYTNVAIAKFSLEHRAKSCWVIMLGDNCKYWIVCLADASKLSAAGYEFLPIGA